jgi:hypothetical protein
MAPVCINAPAPNSSPPGSASAPIAMPANVNVAVVRGRGTGDPCSTGNICIIDPIMTMAMNPSTYRCVIAIAADDARDARAVGPLHSSAAAASSRKAGATRKNRNGTQMGGACSSRSPAWFTTGYAASSCATSCSASPPNSWSIMLYRIASSL